MALFPEKRELTDRDIATLTARIEREENATNVRYIGPTAASYEFQGTVDNREIKFCVDNESGFIVTQEE
ncbi:hypothetical protein [Paenibacillus gansuensis]|uniref:PepSY domain-containing protein n=1 Tax=Paenibacillus gansuensis TaxID=306542 RepID=A0ABW5PJH5_9BACL